MISLLPNDLREAIRFAKLNTAMVQYGIISIVVVVLVAGVMLFGFNIASDDEQALRDSIAQKEIDLKSLVQTEQDAASLADQIDTVGKLLEREVRFSDVLQEIGSILPKGSVLTSLRLANDIEEPLQVSAKVEDKETAAILRQNIEDSERFSSADIESITINLDSNGNPDGFAVSVIASPTNLSANQPAPPEGDES